jgi:hypothetical protein
MPWVVLLEKRHAEHRVDVKTDPHQEHNVCAGRQTRHEPNQNHLQLGNFIDYLEYAGESQKPEHGGGGADHAGHRQHYNDEVKPVPSALYWVQEIEPRLAGERPGGWVPRAKSERCKSVMVWI